MNRTEKLFCGGSIILIFAIGCLLETEAPESNLKPSAIFEKENRFIIVDETGKEWDVTHAKEKYGMEPSGFQFGLGPDAIRPILHPSLLSPEDPGYPHEAENFLVIGTTLDGDSRAYAISDLIDHEIADDKFGDVHVAVAY